jgi:hypothetical protein
MIMNSRPSRYASLGPSAPRAGEPENTRIRVRSDNRNLCRFNWIQLCCRHASDFILFFTTKRDRCVELRYAGVRRSWSGGFADHFALQRCLQFRGSTVRTARPSPIIIWHFKMTMTKAARAPNENRQGSRRDENRPFTERLSEHHSPTQATGVG